MPIVLRNSEIEKYAPGDCVQHRETRELMMVSMCVTNQDASANWPEEIKRKIGTLLDGELIYEVQRDNGCGDFLKESDIIAILDKKSSAKAA